MEPTILSAGRMGEGGGMARSTRRSQPHRSLNEPRRQIVGTTLHATLAAMRAFRQSSRVQELRHKKRQLLLVALFGVALLVWQSLDRDKLTV